MVDPEGDPGEDGQQYGRKIRLEDEVADVSLQQEAQGESGIRPWGGDKRTERAFDSASPL